jgi:hypothetical protein
MLKKGVVWYVEARSGGFKHVSMNTWVQVAIKEKIERDYKDKK